MAETIKIYNSVAEFYASIGGALNQEVDFTIHRLEEIHSEVAKLRTITSQAQ